MPRLDFPAGQRSGPTPPITEHDLITLVGHLLDDPEIPARERVAGILVAIYAQPIVRVARFTIDRINRHRHRDRDPSRPDAGDVA